MGGAVPFASQHRAFGGVPSILNKPGAGCQWSGGCDRLLSAGRSSAVMTVSG